MRHRKKRVVYLITFILTLLALIIGLLFYYFFLPSEKPEIKNNTVVSVIDGDTFEYYDRDSNVIKTVRLLCVNAPEENQEGYEEAKDFLEELILGKQVKMEKDISETDKYGRLLRYVYLNLSDGEMFVNKEIVKNGYGEILIIEPDVKKCGEMN